MFLKQSTFENSVEKGKIVHKEQFLLNTMCFFKKLSACEGICIKGKGVYNHDKTADWTWPESVSHGRKTLTIVEKAGLLGAQGCVVIIAD